jgi:predicted RNA-binding protein with PUA-like domain
MALWLLKTEPSTYSYDDLVADKKATWDGVANNTALIHIRAMKKGDLAIIYHTGAEKAAVGIATVTSDAYADPKENDPKLAVVDLKPLKKLAKPLPLAVIKADPVFAGWDFLRIGRLSVVPVPEKMWKRIEQLSKA